MQAQMCDIISMNNQKGFKDLVFKPHANHAHSVQARLDLGDGIEISVMAHKGRGPVFGGLYGNASEGSYEVAVFQDDKMLPLSDFDDVLAWQSADDINNLLDNLKNQSYIDSLHQKRKEHEEELEQLELN